MGNAGTPAGAVPGVLFLRHTLAMLAYRAGKALRGAPDGFDSPEKIFQGSIVDALTHVGQIATRRRRAGAPVRGENYFRADSAVGRVGPAQSAPRREFD